MAAGRKYRGQTRQELAEELTEAVGSSWSTEMISRLEAGTEPLTNETLMAIAEIQGFPFSFYLEDQSGRLLGL